MSNAEELIRETEKWCQVTHNPDAMKDFISINLVLLSAPASTGSVIDWCLRSGIISTASLSDTCTMKGKRRTQ